MNFLARHPKFHAFLTAFGGVLTRFAFHPLRSLWIGLKDIGRGLWHWLRWIGIQFRLCAVGRLVYVGQHRQAGVLGQAGENARALHQAGSAKALHTGAVGLVVAGLEDVGKAEISGDALNSLGHAPRVALGLDDAGTGDEEKLALAHMDRAYFKGVAHGYDCNAYVSLTPEGRG